jgi:ParB/RepB/Spo0J family partition protein
MAKSSSKPQDALIGKRVRINPELLEDTGMGVAAHPWAGREGEVLTRSEGGKYQVGVGDGVKVLSMGDFTVLDAGALGSSSMVEAAPELAVPSLTNPRRRKGLDIDSLNALAASIKVHSLGQAILVRPLPAARLSDTAAMSPRPIYEVIAGERRLRACVIAGLATMPMLVRDMPDNAVLEMQLVENIEREDLDDMEEAEGFEKLRQQLGYTVEQIAERIGKGKGESYVYKALKLCDLTPESREAMYPADGAKHAVLGRSTGLVVARYAPEQQADVVAFIASLAAPDGEPAPFREVQPKVAKRFNLVLESAPFDIYQVDLVPAAGACSSCPKRSGNQAEIFGDSVGPDSCTDADCFEGKREAHVALIKADAQKDGFKVIDGEDARRARPMPSIRGISGYVRLSDVARVEPGDDGKERQVTWEDQLRSLGKKAPKPRIFIDPHTSQAEKVITAELADKLLPDDQEQQPRGGTTARKTGKRGNADAPEDTRPPKERALDNHHVEFAVLLRVFDAIRAGQRTAEELRLAVKVLILDQEGAEQTLNYLGYLGSDSPDGVSYEDGRQALEAWIDALLPEQLGQLLAMAAVEISFAQYAGTSLKANERVALAERYGIDILAVQAKVAEDLERSTDRALQEEAA